MTQQELIDDLVRQATIRRLQPGEVLCRENEESREAFVVIDGSVEAIINGDLVVATHGPHSLIGEVTSLIGGYRTATLRSVAGGSVAAVDADVLREVFEKRSDDATDAVHRARERTDRTRVAALLAEELDIRDRQVVAAIANEVTWTMLPAGQLLFERGDEADAAYLIVSGRLEGDWQTDGSGSEISRGEIVGELGLLDGRPRTATVRATRDTLLARLSAASFEKLSGDFSGLAMGLVRRVIDRADGRSRRPAPARSVAIVVTAPIEAGALCSRMSQALDPHGSTLHLSAAEVDRRLRQPGIAHTPTGGFGETRLAELIHHAESDFDHLLLEANAADGQWLGRAFHNADQVVIVSSAQPEAAEAEAIAAARAQVPTKLPVWLALLHPADTKQPTGTAALRQRFNVDEVHHLQAGVDGDIARVARLATGRGTALVLSGGGARGFAHLGVLKRLEELGVSVDRVVGTSMGSVIAATIAQRVAPERRVEVLAAQVEKLMDYTLPVVSLLSGKRITKTIENQFGGWDIEDLWLPFACIATNLTTSDAVALRAGPLHFAVRASSAIPGVLPPVPFGEDLLIDGGVLDNLPVTLVEHDRSIETIVASDVTPPRGPRAKQDYGLSVSGWSALRARMGRKGNPYPGLGGVLMRATLIASTRDRDRSVDRGVIDVYLDLDLRGIGLLDFEQIGAAAERGYEAAVERIDTWPPTPVDADAPPTSEAVADAVETAADLPTEAVSAVPPPVASRD